MSGVLMVWSIACGFGLGNNVSDAGPCSPGAGLVIAYVAFAFGPAALEAIVLMRLFYKAIAPPVQAEMERNGFPEAGYFVVMRLLTVPSYMAFAKEQRLSFNKRQALLVLYYPTLASFAVLGSFVLRSVAFFVSYTILMA